MDKSEIVQDRHVFVSIVGREIEEKVPHVLSVVPDHLLKCILLICYSSSQMHLFRHDVDTVMLGGLVKKVL